MSRRFLKSFLFLSITAAVTSSCSYLFPEQDKNKSLRSELDFPGIDYVVDFEINGNKDFESFIIESTQLHHSKKRLPTSTNALRFRIHEDLKRIKKALKNKGFFEAKARAKLINSEKVKKVKITVDTGERYKISGTTITIVDADPTVKFTEKSKQKALRYRNGDDLDQDILFDAVVRLKQHFKDHGYPFVEIDEPIGTLNAKDKTISLSFTVELNKKRKYGLTKVSGQKAVDETFIRNRIVWQEGTIFDSSDVEKTRHKLIDSELFSTVQITPVKDESLNTPISIEVTEAPPRAIGAGVNFNSSEGFGGKLYWQHRNLFGHGEKLTAKIDGSQIDVQGLLSLEVPDTFYKDNTWIIRVEPSYEDTKAYIGTLFNFYTGFKHELTSEFSYSYGLETETSRLKEFRYKTRSFLGLPLSVALDYSNDLINPYKGWRLKAEIEPFIGDLGTKNAMFKFITNGSFYLPLLKPDRFTTAFWGRVGQIRLINYNDIPLNRKFYSGGAGSIRGYGYQKVGPINANSDPAGGQSLVEFGIEPRLKITDTIGIAAFAEAGTVALQKTPRFDKDNLFVGLGVGFRYYTAIGPFRLDVAVPTRRRKVNNKYYDAPFQIYISVGQSF